MPGAEQWYKYQSRLLWHPFKLTKLFDSLAWLIKKNNSLVPCSQSLEIGVTRLSIFLCLVTCNWVALNLWDCRLKCRQSLTAELG
jgi:hypothetical protein